MRAVNWDLIVFPNFDFGKSKSGYESTTDPVGLVFMRFLVLSTRVKGLKVVALQENS